MTSPFEEKGNGDGRHVRRRKDQDYEYEKREDLGDNAAEGPNGDESDD